MDLDVFCLLKIQINVMRIQHWQRTANSKKKRYCLNVIHFSNLVYCCFFFLLLNAHHNKCIGNIERINLNCFVTINIISNFFKFNFL